MTKNHKDNKTLDGLQSLLNPRVDRRKFLKVSSALSSAAVVVPSLIKFKEAEASSYAENDTDALETDSEVKLVYSVCLMCHSSCGTRGRVKDGVLIKVDGNPYHPNCLESDERLKYTDDPASSTVKMTNGRLCPKGQAAIQTIYDPYRIKNPLKKIGDRDSEKWEEITWATAIDEIADILKDIWDNDTDIDTKFPEYGKVANKLVVSAGRIEHGQKEFTDRIFKDGFGTVNYRHDHTSICEVSHHTGNNLLTDYKKNHFKPDIVNCEYIIWWGSNPLEASFPMNALGRKTAEFLKNGGKMDVVDPRFSNSAAKAVQTGGRWVAVKPGADAALALGMALWIIDNKKYDEGYLKLTQAGKANTMTGNTEQTYTDATYLVDTLTGKFLTAEDAGLGGESDKSKNVVWDGGTAKIYDAVDSAEILPGQVTVNEKTCKTAFEIFKDSLETIAGYAAICGISQTTIEAMASDFTSHGKKAVANPYRGPVKHTNGAFGLLAVQSLNMLIGNFDWKGGYTIGGGHWHEVGTTSTMNLSKVPSGVTPSGVPLTRFGKEYEEDAPNLYAKDGYPAKRVWQPLLRDWNYQEILPSIDDGYPYAIDTLITYWNNILYSVPAGKEEGTRILKDKAKVPHFIAFDILIGETSALADYILPDTTHLERWSTPHVAPTILAKTSGFRQPYVGTFDDTTEEYNYYVSYLRSGNIAKDLSAASGPQLLEDILIALAKKLSEKKNKAFPGVGDSAFALEDKNGTAVDSGKGWTTSLTNAWDYYKNILINFKEESGKPATIQEILDRGGVFADSDTEYDGDYIASKYKGILHFHIEKLTTTKDSTTGQPFDSLGVGAKYVAPQGLNGTAVATDSTYPYTIITYKPVIHAQARTICNPWLQMIMPENFVEMNATDAAALGVETGDTVKITSKDGVTAIGKVRIKKIQEGVVAVAHSYGHWEMASKSNKVTKDGVTSVPDFDKSRGAGIYSSPFMMLDPDMGCGGLGSKNVCLQDPVGGSASFYDSPVKIEKV